MKAGRTPSYAAVIAIAVTVSCFAVTAASAKPPAGGTFFTVFLGLDGPFAQGADCLRFTGDRLCTTGGLCGSWRYTQPVERETEIAFGFAFEEDGTPVEISGRARINSSGRWDSLAAAAVMRSADANVNFGFVGRSTGPRNCLRLWGDWSRQNPPLQGEKSPACTQRARFGDAAASAYILPYPASEEYRVSQTYCYADAGHRDQLAYDFATTIGSQVIASRAGVVREIRQDLPDDGISGSTGDHNHVYIEHDDGTVAFYAHLQQNRVIVRVGDRVEAGQPIAFNGFSGDIGEPHLHFGVYRQWPVTEGDDVPISFRNAMGPLDRRGGLLSGVFYRALPTAVSPDPDSGHEEP